MLVHFLTIFLLFQNSLEWHTVPANESTHNVTVKTNKNYQFAISVNTPTSNSGMKWAKCTVLETGNKLII